MILCFYAMDSRTDSVDLVAVANKIVGLLNNQQSIYGKPIGFSGRYKRDLK